MGRYYTGDIDGKFWFGVQSSDSPSRFGGEEEEPNYIKYYFEKDSHYTQVCKELDAIRKNLGEYKQLLDKFFDEKNGYNDEMLIEYGIPKDKVSYLLSEYADLDLGEKIKKCLEDNDECNIEAEC